MNKDMNIMILGDDRSLVNFASRLVGRIGTSACNTAYTFNEAKSLLADGSIDVLITSPHMADMETADLLAFVSDLENPPHFIFFEGKDDRVLSTIKQLVSEHKMIMLGSLQTPVQLAEVETLLQNFKGRKIGKPKITQSHDVLSIEELRLGIDEGALFPFFQPKIEIKTGKMVGVECLARWKKPDGKMVFPDQFIPIAEKNGLINALTKSVYLQAMEQAAEWQVDGLDIKISVNASMDDLEDPTFADFIIKGAEDAGVILNRVVIEVTETKLMTDIKASLACLSKLRQRGIGVSIDDYGTGFSSLKQVSQVPATELKVDREFVYEAWKNKEKRVLLETSIEMGKKLNLSVVAEGAETLKDWRLLEELGCDVVQGYFCAKPMVGPDVISWYDLWKTKAPKPKPRKSEGVGSPSRVWQAVLAVVVIGLLYGGFGDYFKPPIEIVQNTHEDSIAVLPFVNMSSDPEQEFFSDGISEEILNVLTKIPNLQVAGRTASFAYKGQNPNFSEVGRNLNVNYVLEGSVRKSGNKLRITAQLIRAQDGFHLWSKTYDRELTDVFDIQDELSKAIAESLAISMGIETGASLITDRTDVPEAYESYLKARQFYSARGPLVKDALVEVNNALEFDPSFVPAWALLAKVYSVYPLYVGIRTSERRAKYSNLAQIVANKTLAFDPNSAEAMVALANVYKDSRKIVLAHDLYIRALEINPKDADTHMQMGEIQIQLGYTKKAVEQMKSANNLDPGVPINMDSYAWALVDDGQLKKAEEILLEAIKLAPTLNMISNVYTKTLTNQGRYDDVLAFHEKTANLGVKYLQDNIEDLREILSSEEVRADIRTPILINLAMVNRLPMKQVFEWGLIKAFTEMVINDPYNSIPFLPPYKSTLWVDPDLREVIKQAKLLEAWKKLGFPKYCEPRGDDDFMCGPEVNLGGLQ